MDRLTAMEVFVRVAEEGSFSAAARGLGMSNSAVSKHIAMLEDLLGVCLLNRTTRQVSLTEAGHAYHERCEQILCDVEETQQSVAQLQTEPRGTLKINAPVFFGSQYLVTAIADFQASYPRISVEMSLTDRYVDVIGEGFDISIRVGQLCDSNLIARKLASSRNIVCTSPAYLCKHDIPQTPEDLLTHNCLKSISPSYVRGWPFRGPKGNIVVPIKGCFRTNNGDALLAAALSGMGFAHLPAFIIGHNLRTGKLRSVLVEYEEPAMDIYALYPHRRHLSMKVRVFIDFIVARFASGLYWDQ